MNQLDVSKRAKRQTFLAAIAIGLCVFVLGAPVVQAAISRVKLAGGTATAKIKGSDGHTIDVEPVVDMGFLQAEGSAGAVDVRTFSAGGGLLGAGDCTASREPAQGPLSNTVTLPSGAIVTELIITGTGTVRMVSQAVNENIPLANFTVNASNPNESVGFGNGLTLTSPTTFVGIDGSACNFMVVGQGPGVNPLAP